MTTERIYNVLFICTGNSARSIIAESLLNHYGNGRFRGYSAGSMPKGEVHPIALATLKKLGLPNTGYRSKNWDEFTQPDAPLLDFIITVCDNAAGEVCPVWLGQPVTAHWGIPDPAAVEGSETEQHLAFSETARIFRRRLELFISLPLPSLDAMSLQSKLDEIGKQDCR